MKINIGIASTTHVDRHHERMAKSALDGMAKQIKEKFIPQLIEHDWNRHVGVILYGEVFQLEDGEYALGIVFGIFEEPEEKTKFEIGKPNNVWQKYEKYLDIEELKQIQKDNSKKDKKVEKSKISKPNNIADLLEKHIDSTQVLPDSRVCKIKRYIASVGDLVIEVYPNDHYPPHFHVVSKQRKINARFNLETLEYINTKIGTISSKDIKKIQNFFEVMPQSLKFLKEEYARFNTQ